MKKLWTFTIACLLAIPAGAQKPGAADAFSAEEAAAVAALLANQAKEEAAAAQAKAEEEKIVLPEETKKQAQQDANAKDVAAQEEKPAQTAAEKTENPEEKPTEEKTSDEEKEDEKDAEAKAACLTVAFVDIDVAFNEHPRTIAVKQQIRDKILAKEDEVARAKDEIEIRTRENNLLAALVREIKPFYERIVVEPHPLLPRVEEPADTLELTNLLNRLTFAQAEVLSASPLNTPAQLEDILARMAENKKVIEERSFFIDN